MSKVINYYASSNTSKGFVSFFNSNLKDMRKIFIIKGGPGSGKSTLMKKLGKYWEDCDIEYIHCSSDNDSVDGIINTNLKIAIVDGTAPHVIEPTIPGAIGEYINLSDAWDIEFLEENKEKLEDLNLKIQECYKNAYLSMNMGLKIHDEWEAIYLKNMDFEKADKLADDLIQKILKEVRYDKKSRMKHRFIGASTPDGACNTVENLTEDIGKRYFIKGRPGTGKSTILKKIAFACDNRGIDVDIYHCGFDPDSLDMLIFNELDICIFDATAPHEFFPTRDSDEILDFYSAFVKEGTDEENKEEIDKIAKRYAEVIKISTDYLKQAKKYHDELEMYYITATDFRKLDKVYNKLIKRIKKY